MFNIGDHVSYRTEGICVVTDIRTENFGNMGDEEYYILAPIREPNSVLYVPANNELLVSKMLPLLSASQICDLAKELRDQRIEWRNESRVRNHMLRDIINRGDRVSLILLVNTLSEKKDELLAEGKKLTAGDESILKRAKKMLLDEFSFTSDIKDEETLMLVLECKVECASLT